MKSRVGCVGKMMKELQDSSKIRVRLSKIQFPEACPVCLKEPEDLVFVTIVEKTDTDYTSGSWNRQEDKVDVALSASRGAATFAIPTCMLHGSRSVRTLRMKLIAAFGFFVLFYPILYFLLQINLALVYSRSLVPPLLGFIGITSILVIILLYGLFPRALERTIRFHDVIRTNDSVVLSIANRGYRELFLEINEMTAEVLDNEHTKAND